MIVENGKFETDIEFNQDIQFKGMCVGSVVVKENTYLLLNGMVTKNLVLEEGSSVDLHGAVNGNVINRGGNLHIYGVVDGSVTGEATIEPDAIIRG